jgi:hypothetical protein
LIDRHLYSCVKFSGGKFCLRYQLFHGLIELAHGGGHRTVGGLGAAVVLELREARANHAVMHLGEKQADAQPRGGDLIAVRAGDLGDDAVQAQSSQIRGHATGGIVLESQAQ